jgi:hypothetical protein
VFCDGEDVRIGEVVIGFVGEVVDEVIDWALSWAVVPMFELLGGVEVEPVGEMDNDGVMPSKDRIFTSVFCHIIGIPSQRADVEEVIVVDIKLGNTVGVMKGAW